ncbi:unnamed protein product [Brachionus calyciflorus]|uniref:Uncharacterized protein n=1 Tax=Brachionus calyciflorus TaxID=104777 RepID=A0A814FAZ4_9BILA|nr:unnamed protein product [Brachionus calyciflorus]
MKEFSTEFNASWGDLKSDEAIYLTNKQIKSSFISLLSDLVSKHNKLNEELKLVSQQNDLQDQTIANLKLILEKKQNEQKLNEEKLAKIREENNKHDATKVSNYEKKIVQKAKLLGEEEAKFQCYKTLLQ